MFFENWDRGIGRVVLESISNVHTYYWVSFTDAEMLQKLLYDCDVILHTLNP